MSTKTILRDMTRTRDGILLRVVQIHDRTGEIRTHLEMWGTHSGKWFTVVADRDKDTIIRKFEQETG